MAVQYVRARYIGRKGGGSATRSAAYNMRDRIYDLQSKQTHDFTPPKEQERDDKQYREKPIYHAVLLPEGAPDAFKDNPAVLWNAAEASERRSNSQVVREVLLALPNDAEVNLEDWKVMATTFAETHFRSKGLAVQLDIHAEDRNNPHCHLLVSTRYVTPEGFGAKARDLHPDIRRVGGRLRASAEHLGEQWRQHQSSYFESRGYELRVEPIALVPRSRLRMIGRDDAADEALAEHIAEHRRLNAEAAADASNVLAAMTRHDIKFTEAGLDRFLAKHLPDPAERIAVKAQIMAHPELVDRAARHLDGGGYTTRQVEQAARKAEPRKPGRINPRLDSRYNRGGGHYDEDNGPGRRL